MVVRLIVNIDIFIKIWYNIRENADGLKRARKSVMKRTIKLMVVTCIMALMCVLLLASCETPYYKKATVDSFVLELEEAIANSIAAQEAKISALETQYKADIAKLETENASLQTTTS